LLHCQAPGIPIASLPSAWYTDCLTAKRLVLLPHCQAPGIPIAPHPRAWYTDCLTTKRIVADCLTDK